MDTRLIWTTRKADVPGWAYIIALILGLALIVIAGYIIARSAGIQVATLGDLF